MDDLLTVGLLVLAYGILVPHALAGLLVLLDPGLKEAKEDAARLTSRRS